MKCMFGAMYCKTQRSGLHENLEQEYLKDFDMWCWRRMEEIKWSGKVINEKNFENIGEKRTLLNNILHRKANWDWSYSKNKLPSSCCH